MNAKQLFCLVKKSSSRVKIQSHLKALFVYGGTEQPKHYSGEQVSAMFAFMARVYPNVEHVVLRFIFEMIYDREELQKLFEVRRTWERKHSAEGAN